MERGQLGRSIRAALFWGSDSSWQSGCLPGYSTRRIAAVERQAAEINAWYMHAQELLANVRAQVLLGSVYMRDALLDPDPTNCHRLPPPQRFVQDD